MLNKNSFLNVYIQCEKVKTNQVLLFKNDSPIIRKKNSERASFETDLVVSILS